MAKNLFPQLLSMVTSIVFSTAMHPALAGDGPYPFCEKSLQGKVTKVMEKEVNAANQNNFNQIISQKYDEKVRNYVAKDVTGFSGIYSAEAEKFMNLIWDANKPGQFSELPQEFDDLKFVTSFFVRTSIDLVGELFSNQKKKTMERQKFQLIEELSEEFQDTYADTPDVEKPVKKLYWAIDAALTESLAKRGPEEHNYVEPEYLYHDTLGHLLGDALSFMEFAFEEVRDDAQN